MSTNRNLNKNLKHTYKKPGYKKLYKQHVSNLSKRKKKRWKDLQTVLIANW